MDVHSLTGVVSQKILSEIEIQNWSYPIKANDFKTLFAELHQNYGNHIALQNIQTHSKNGLLLDPDLPPINFLLILNCTWKLVKKFKLQKYFNQTLNQIGNTCVQGISHRLFLDFNALVQQ